MSTTARKLRLTDLHERILKDASARDDGDVILPADLSKDEVRRTLRSLIRRELIKRDPDTTNGKMASYRITARGRDALVTTPTADAEATAQAANESTASLMPAEAKPGTKTQLVIDLIRQPTGATIDELRKATGWLPHNVRAALSGLRKKGLMITCTRVKDGVSHYRCLGSKGA